VSVNRIGRFGWHFLELPDLRRLLSVWRGKMEYAVNAVIVKFCEPNR
jgi:hypothetical protein